MGSIIAVVGDDRGVGTTTVVSLVGSALSEQLRQTALIDGSHEGSRLSDLYDLHPETTLVEMLRRGRQPVDVRTAGPHGSDLYLGTDDADWAAVPPTSIQNCYEHLRDRVEVALVDVGTVGDPAAVPWLGYADEYLVITDSSGPNRVDELDTVGTLYDVQFRGTIVNGVGADAIESTAAEWAQHHLPLLSVLPRDDVANASVKAGTSVLSHDPNSELATIGWQLAESLVDSAASEPILPEGVSVDLDGPTRVSTELDPTEMVTEQTPEDPTASTEMASPEPDEQSTEPGAVDETTAPEQSVDVASGSDSLNDHVDDLGDFEEVSVDGGSAADDVSLNTEDGIGDWRDVDIDDHDETLDDEPPTVSDTDDELSDWGDSEIGEYDELDELSGSNTDGGLSGWGRSNSEDETPGDSTADADTPAEDPDDEIEAAFQEAMERARDKGIDDENPSVEDLLE